MRGEARSGGGRGGGEVRRWWGGSRPEAAAAARYLVVRRGRVHTVFLPTRTRTTAAPTCRVWSLATAWAAM